MTAEKRLIIVEDTQTKHVKVIDGIIFSTGLEILRNVNYITVDEAIWSDKMECLLSVWITRIM